MKKFLITLEIAAKDDIDALNKGESLKRLASLFSEKDLHSIIQLTETAVNMGKTDKNPMNFLGIGKKLIAFFIK